MKSRRATVEDLFSVDLQAAQTTGDPRPFLPTAFTDDELNILGARTMEHEERIIACYGLVPCRPGVAEAWALLSEESLKHAKDLTADVIYWLEWAEKQHLLRRVQATVREGHAAAHRWMLWLGFQPEGRMRAFGMRGEAHWMYGRISDERT